MNMYHLINEFQPHQVRETLLVMLHVQKKKRLQLADKFQEHLDKVQETIQNALMLFLIKTNLQMRVQLQKITTKISVYIIKAEMVKSILRVNFLCRMKFCVILWILWIHLCYQIQTELINIFTLHPSKYAS